MIVRKWLTLNNRGLGRLTKSKPSIDHNEISILLEIDIPNAYFNKPRLEAKITIPADGAEVINGEVVENAKEAIEQATGLTFAISVIKETVED